jgi:TonB family protein
MDVSDVLRDRMQEPAGLRGMVTLSTAVHAGLIALAILAPNRWLAHGEVAPRTVMTITLGGGSEGPQSGGLTSIGGRPVQTTAPPENPAKREAVRPPAPKPPEMTLPTRGAKPAASQASVNRAPEDARGRTPTRGAELRAGSAVAETGARGQGFGLSTGGGSGSGSYLDVANFCCPEYLATMIERIRSHWSPQAEVAGETVIVFSIQRDGRLTGFAVEKSSGYAALDLTAERALAMTQTLPPLPAAFPNPTLTVHLNFQYQR